jgi:hypothetical protein
LIRVRRPTADFPVTQEGAIPRLDRPIAGTRVGLRKDDWRSWRHICELWDAWLARDGARAVHVITGTDRAGERGDRTLASLQAWGGEIDCAVVGLGS